MCVDPLTAVSIAGVGLNAVGALAKGNAEGAMLDAKSAEYRSQSDLAHRQAVIEQVTSQYQQRRKVEQVGALQGAQRNALASAGVLLDTGSAADIGTDTQREGLLDVAAIQWNAKLKAQNLDFQGAQASMNAETASQAAKTARSTGYLGALAAGVGGIGKLPSDTLTKLGLKF